MCHLVMAFNVLHLAMPLSVLALLVLPGSAQGPLNATLVSSAKQLADTLSNFHVGNIHINGTVVLTSGTWKPIGGTVTVVDRSVNITTMPGSPQPAVIDLGQVVDAIMIGDGGKVQFNNLTLQNAAPRNVMHTDTHARYKIRTFGPWPSITILPNATVILNHTVNTYDSEPSWEQCTLFQEKFRAYAVSWMPNQNLLNQGNDTLYIEGSYLRPVEIKDLLINETVGSANLGTINNSIVCQPNAPIPAGPAPAPAYAAAGAGAQSASSSSSGTPGWLIAAIVVPIAVLVVAVAALATLMIRKRQLDKRKQAQDPDLLKDSGTPHGSGLQGYKGRSLPKGYLADMEGTRIGATGDEPPSSVDEDQLGELPSSRSGKMDNLLSLPETLRKRSSRMVDNLELGTPLGRGSYGKVYKGKWKGVTVAVKIVEHSAETEGELLQLRESMLSSSIVHPNVIATYKVRTVRVLEESQMTDSAASGSGHIEKHDRPPDPPDLSASSGTAGPEIDGGSQDMRETWMLLEYADRGNLDRALVQKKMMTHDKLLDMDTVCRCLIDIAAGMDYLHSLGVLHGDLKGANVLLKSSGDDPRGYVCKLADFGLSRVLEAHATHVSTKTYGTLAYMPAELLQDGKMSRAADVYSFSMIMWELFACKRLYEGHIASQVFFKVLMGCRPTIPEHMPEDFQKLMVQCWDTDAEKRPTFEEILKRLQELQRSLEPMPLTSKGGSLGQFSVGPSEFTPASAGWEHRVMSAMGTADAAPASAMLEAPPWMLRSVSNPASMERPNRSLDRMDTQELKGVFSTGSSRQELSPARAARQAQTISAALVAEMEVSGRASKGSSASSGSSLVFLGNQRPKPMAAWKPPRSDSSSAHRQQAESPHSQSSPMRPSLSARPRSESAKGTSAASADAADRPSRVASPSADAGSPPGTRDLSGHVSDASDRGLHVPDAVSRWVSSQRCMSGKAGPAQGSKAVGKAGAAEQGAGAEAAEGDTGGGNFTDSVPMDLFREPR